MTDFTFSSDIIPIRVDELDEKPRIYRRLSEPHRNTGIQICDNTSCNNVCKKMKICEGCQFNRYCSEECQKRDWWFHKNVCVHTCAKCKNIFKDLVGKQISVDGKVWNRYYCSKECEETDLV